MERHPDEAETALAAMWANELGGRLNAKLLDELYGSKKPLREEPDLFEASEQKFVAFGKTKLEHRAWRQREVKLLRFTQLHYLTWSINQDHPRFATDATDEDEPEYLPIGQEPIREPDITLQELDAEVTEWYLQKERETSFEVPTEIKNEAHSHEPKSVTYMRWKQQSLQSEAQPKPDISEEQGVEIQRAEIAENEEWRFLSEENLEGDKLSAIEVSSIIHQWLLKQGKGSTIHTLAKIKNALAQAQYDASSASRNCEGRLPVRLRKFSGYYFDCFAMTEIGKRGRPQKGDHGSTYKLIKDSDPTSDPTKPTSDQISDESGLE
jgi:hypothetical protein